MVEKPIDEDHAIADFVAEIAAGLERIANRRQRSASVGVGVEGSLIERDLVSLERVAAAEVPIFGHREAERQRSTRAQLGISRVAISPDEIEAAIVAPEQPAAEQNVLVEEIRLDEACLDGFRINGPVD